MMDRQRIFLMAVQALAIMLDLRTDRSISARVVAAAGSQDLPVDEHGRNEGELAEDYVQWQYGNRPKPAWVKL